MEIYDKKSGEKHLEYIKRITENRIEYGLSYHDWCILIVDRAPVIFAIRRISSYE